MQTTFPRAGLLAVLLATAAALLSGGRPAAAPKGIAAANDYATVGINLIASTATRFTYQFTVANVSPANNKVGIASLAVYSPIGPLTASHPAGTTVTRYTEKRGYTEWVLRKGNKDVNKDRIPDGYIAPGETVPNSAKPLSFELTFNRAIDPAEFDFAVLVFDPGRKGPFYAHPNPSFCGQTLCADANGVTNPIAGAQVELVNANTLQVVATATSDANGNYLLTTNKAGDYFVRAAATDFSTAFTNATNFSLACPNICQNLTLQAAAINYRASNDMSGLVFFSDTPSYRLAADQNRVLTGADLTNAAFTFSQNGGKTYRYTGPIPSFPELGSFGGPGQKEVWVLILQPLLPEDRYANHSFVNLVEVQDGIGQAVDHQHAPYTVRFLSVLPFDGPGTVRSLQTQGLRVDFASPDVQVNANPTWSDLAPVLANGQAAPAAPPAGVIPAGFMNRTRFSIRVPSGVKWTAFATVSFKNICGNGSTAVTTDPEVPAAP